uniref:Uncharacterized protein n=1 Tax=Romanomermis culicivorax TaxID=13658 RepID=A0A915IW96_ROMCU
MTTSYSKPSQSSGIFSPFPVYQPKSSAEYFRVLHNAGKQIFKNEGTAVRGDAYEEYLAKERATFSCAITTIVDAQSYTWLAQDNKNV